MKPSSANEAIQHERIVTGENNDLHSKHAMMAAAVLAVDVCHQVATVRNARRFLP